MLLYHTMPIRVVMCWQDIVLIERKLTQCSPQHPVSAFLLITIWTRPY